MPIARNTAFRESAAGPEAGAMRRCEGWYQAIAVSRRLIAHGEFEPVFDDQSMFDRAGNRTNVHNFVGAN